MRAVLISLLLGCSEVLGSPQSDELTSQQHMDEIPTIFEDGAASSLARDGSRQAWRRPAPAYAQPPPSYGQSVPPLPGPPPPPPPPVHPAPPPLHPAPHYGQQYQSFHPGPSYPWQSWQPAPSHGMPAQAYGFPAPFYGRPPPFYGQPGPSHGPLAHQRGRRGINDQDNDLGIPVENTDELHSSAAEDLFRHGLPPASQTSRAPLARSAADRYLRKISDSARRRRRDTAAAGPSNWWFDPDSGRPNGVTAALREDNPYVGAQLDRARLMDQVGAPISVTRGTVNRFPPAFGFQPPPFGYQPPRFGIQPPPFGYQPPPFGIHPSPFGYQPPPFGHQPPPFGYQPPPGNFPPAPSGYLPAPFSYLPEPDVYDDEHYWYPPPPGFHPAPIPAGY